MLELQCFLRLHGLKDPQIQPDIANKPASTVATVNKNSVQCPALSVETTPSVAPCCGSDASSRGSPIANRTRGNQVKLF